tara:strand:+ start:685 stop:969 length:285 start_codon:yes stop_codon:yes gene_type:complete
MIKPAWITPGFSHALLGAALTVTIGLPCALVGLPSVIGAVFAIGFYVGRERRQSEEHFGSNRIMPWQWKPRAGRDVAWPALSSVVVALLIELAF